MWRCNASSRYGLKSSGGLVEAQRIAWTRVIWEYVAHNPHPPTLTFTLPHTPSLSLCNDELPRNLGSNVRRTATSWAQRVSEKVHNKQISGFRVQACQSINQTMLLDPAQSPRHSSLQTLHQNLGKHVTIQSHAPKATQTCHNTSDA